ncbi:hypothetical protein K7X08_037794 [Anisodus acutangulus]|uniref:Uncharacterized protein n=1 Tax=Anisodus acutangulus TaxID=402998 RepID=A0A9Q1RPQ9_9SOLA|nr:hypothetical protein K7X08_037794 [Anisodus acutangulus]
MGDVGINKENLNGDTLRASTGEIQEGGDLSGELIEAEDIGYHQHGQMPIKKLILENEQDNVNQQDHVIVNAGGFSSQILIEIFQNTYVDCCISSHEETHVSVDEKSDSAPSDADLSFVHGVVAVSDEAAECDDLQTSQKMVSYSQFEFPDELLPSQVPPTRIVMTLRKERRLGLTQISLF